MVKKCDSTCSAIHRFMSNTVICYSTVNTHTLHVQTEVLHTAHLHPGVTKLTSLLDSAQLHTQLPPFGKPMTSLAGVFELQSILGKMKCSKPISTPPCAGHTRSQSEYTEVSDVTLHLVVGETPFRFPTYSSALVQQSRASDIRYTPLLTRVCVVMHKLLNVTVITHQKFKNVPNNQTRRNLSKINCIFLLTVQDWALLPFLNSLNDLQFYFSIFVRPHRIYLSK